MRRGFRITRNEEAVPIWELLPSDCTQADLYVRALEGRRLVVEARHAMRKAQLRKSATNSRKNGGPPSLSSRASNKIAISVAVNTRSVPSAMPASPKLR